jgi:tRNA A-37 threonylcarbamoyl transferase component Bud32/isoprenylcysteine carboxyl methyltransferase (ICMT) family protein YpbQ
MASPNNLDKASGKQTGLASKSALQRLTGAIPGRLTESFLPDSDAALLQRSVKVIRVFSVALWILALLFSSAAVVGWVFNIDPLKHMLYNQLTGFPTAFWLGVVTISSAPAVCNIDGNKLAKVVKIIARLGLVISFAAGMTLWLEHLLGQDWNINIPVFQPLGADVAALTLPGPTPVDVSFCIALTSFTALCLDLLGTKMPLLFQGLSLLVALPSFFLVLACIFGVRDAFDVFCAYQGCVNFKYLNYTILFSLHTAIFLSRPTAGMTSFLAVDSMGGRQVRMSILGSLLMIPVAWVLVTANRNEIINQPTALVIGMIVFIITVGVLAAYGARKIDKIDQEKQATEQSLSELSAMRDSQFIYKMICLECGKEFPDGFEACPYDASALSRVLDKLAPGSVFVEKYEIAEALGSGGMSTVYKAQHLFLDKVVAIKLLNQQLASDAKSVQRFQVEAKAAFDLNHPNLLGVYDFGMSGDGQAYIVMDYLEGESLAEIIQREKQIGLVRALPIFLDICKGLAYAHEQGVLHRDIKPSNVMLVKGPNGKDLAKIVDFGLAKVFDENAMKLTQTGEIFGSPLYMSPEQCRGLQLDHRSDLYSMGVLMYEALAGRAPIMGTNVYDTFQKKMTELPPPFEPSLMVPEWLGQLIFCLLRCEPKERPASARVLVTAINQYVK